MALGLNPSKKLMGVITPRLGRFKRVVGLLCQCIFVSLLLVARVAAQSAPPPQPQPPKPIPPAPFLTQQQSLDYCNAVREWKNIVYNIDDGVANGEGSFTPCIMYNYLGKPVAASTPNSPYNYQFTEYVSAIDQGTFAGADFYYSTTSAQPEKNLGKGKPCGCNNTTMVGEPINASTGNKYLREDDIQIGPRLSFSRFYNNFAGSVAGSIGAYWRDSFDSALNIIGSPATSIGFTQPDGLVETFTKTNAVWTSDADVNDVLTEIDNAQGMATNYTVFVAAEHRTDTFNAAGLLQSITDASGQGIALTYSTVATPYSIAPTTGLLITATDPQGRQLNLTYNSLGYVSLITLPDGGQLIYSYDTGAANLLSVKYPDGSMRQYTYNESSYTSGENFPSAMTGLIDETNTRYETTTYNSAEQATSSYFAGNVGTTQIAYNSNGTASITYPLGLTSTMTFATLQGVNDVSAISAPCGPQCDQPWKSIAYNTSGYPQTSVDFNGNTTATTYNSSNLLATEVDAQGTSAQRTTNLTWNTTLRVPLTRTVANASGTIVSGEQWFYNTTGQTLAYCAIDPTNSADNGYSCSNTGTVPAGVRRTTYTYCTTTGGNCPLPGLLLSVTGPRTDLTQTTSYSYYTSASTTNCGTPGAACYQPGDLYQVTDALGHVTTLASYDADGRITRITDPNGVNTDLTYYPRGWLKTRTVGGAQTSFTYTAYGAVQTITDPDGVTTTFGYDTAHRLTKITDALGNTIQYTLDAAGDKTGESVYDSTGTLHKSLSRTFNTLGQLTTVVDGLNHTVFNASASTSYDANGNLIQSSDGLGFQRQLGYDALNRLQQTIDNYNGTDSATKNTSTGYQYDSLDRLTQVTDPSNLATTYGYDGLSNATSQHSPDTGSTARSFDAAGNLLTRTDAKGITATNTYDAQNRLTSTSYPDSTQNVTYTYDEGNGVTGCSSSDPIGRLTRIIENSVTTLFCYDALGRVIQKQTITATATDTRGYSYTAAGRLSGVVYADGSMVSYTRDGDGRIQSISATPAGGTASTVASNFTYQPFGPVSGYTLGNGQQITRTYDANYRLTDLTSPAFTLHVARDAMGDITAIGNAPGANPAAETYTYDPLYRLLSITEANGSVLESVTYNPTGDRLTKTGSGLDTGTYTYNANTHQLNTVGNNAFSVDANGNTTAMTQAGSTYGFGYNDRNRMTVAQLGGSTMATYLYDALGERIQKVTGTATERYDYNEAGQLLGEYGATNRDYIWADGIPVANIDTTGTTSTIAYVTADQLGTPRAIANSSGTTEWQLPYQGNPWNEVAPTSTGYTYNLGLPGMYFDAETGQMNWGFRTYNSGIGRSPQSDPMGVFGGQWSTYAYVTNNPLSWSDPYGLAPDNNKAWRMLCWIYFAACNPDPSILHKTPPPEPPGYEAPAPDQGNPLNFLKKPALPKPPPGSCPPEFNQQPKGPAPQGPQPEIAPDPVAPTPAVPPAVPPDVPWFFLLPPGYEYQMTHQPQTSA
jgi:RHS repeat-associated protein